MKENSSTIFRSTIKKLLKPLFRKLLPGDKDLFVALKLLKNVRSSNKDIDLLISVGLPFSIHLVSYIGITLGYLRTKVAFAEYGDPFSGSPQKNTCVYCSILERLILRKFDKVVVPVVIASQAFNQLVAPSKISVIPQGYI